jgi:hypothetical protein
MNDCFIKLLATGVARREVIAKKPPVAIKTSQLFAATSSQQSSHLSAPTKSLRAFSSSHSNEIDDYPSKQLSTEEIHAAQTRLLSEANYLTKTLYRKCLKSIQSLARGNERDEIDFSEREKSEQDELDELFSSSSKTSKDSPSSNSKQKVSLMAPPVNRQNELASRANYYRAFTREHFDGHWNLLGRHGFHLGEEGNMRHGLGSVGGGGSGQEGNRYEGGHHHLGGQMAAQYSPNNVNNKIPQQQKEYYMWREEQIEQFTYLITSGEEKRQWILNDYEFDDPCGKYWPEELRTRIRQFEESANTIVKEMYRRRGWIHSSDHEQYAKHANEDSDSDDEDL